jgi:beta-lactamase regulating signal transducer with metallopeptidase domain/HEAT repeat protein
LDFTLADIALQGTLLLLAAFLAAAILRRSSAAARHLVWLTAMLGMLLLPLLGGILPAWRVLPPPLVVSAIAAAPSPSIAIPQPAPLPLSSPASRAPREPVPVMTILETLWALGALLALAPLAIGWFSIWRLASSAEPAPSWLSRDLTRGQKVRLLLTPHRSMPMTWGLFHPRLLLPAEASTWTPEERRVVLLHELAHIRRRDVLAQFIARLACALHWFNPLVWLAARRMSLDCEQACDDAVLLSGASASAYADQLLRIASTHSRNLSGAVAIAMARPSKLERRLLAILDPTRVRRAPSVLLVAVASSLLLLAVPVAMLHATPQAPPAPTPQAPAVPQHPPAPQAPASTSNLHEVVRQAVTSISTRSAGDPGVAAALQSLRSFPESAVVSELVPYLANPQNTMRRSAIHILTEGPVHSIDAAVDPLKQLCHHSEDFTRGMAALALGKHRILSAEPLLTAMATADTSPYARRAAAAALGLLGDPAALPALRKAAADSDEMVASNANDAIAQLAPPANNTENIWKTVSQAVTTISNCAEGDPKLTAAMATLRDLPESAALPLVVSYLSDSRNTIRRAAIAILYEGPFHSIDAAVAPLQELCRHQESLTRGMAALALGKRRIMSSEPLLTGMALGDSSPYARRAAAYALGLLGDPAALPALEKVGADPDPNVAANAKEAIRLLRPVPSR